MDIPNFGDQLNRDLFFHYGVPCEPSKPDQAELVGVGSILGFVDSQFDGAILGAGFLSDTCWNPFFQAAVHAVRGKLSRERTGRRWGPVLGDPGLLADRIYQRSEPRFALGLVPHYVDAQAPIIRQLASQDSKNVLVVDVTCTPAKVFEQISECEVIASSSLHGLVVADSLGIPNVWLRLSDAVLGSGFKFQDYYSAYGRTPHWFEPTSNCSMKDIRNAAKSPPDNVCEIKAELERIFKRLPQILGEVRQRRSSRFRRLRRSFVNRGVRLLARCCNGHH